MTPCLAKPQTNNDGFFRYGFSELDFGDVGISNLESNCLEIVEAMFVFQGFLIKERESCVFRIDEIAAGACPQACAPTLVGRYAADFMPGALLSNLQYASRMLQEILDSESDSEMRRENKKHMKD
jgi:hypothetical protein